MNITLERNSIPRLLSSRSPGTASKYNRPAISSLSSSGTPDQAHTDWRLVR